jgi:anthranilate synthase component 2
LAYAWGIRQSVEAFGAKVSYAKTLMHGKQSDILIDNGCSLFKGLPEKIKAARYHSLPPQKRPCRVSL